jgi:hypothetical protein
MFESALRWWCRQTHNSVLHPMHGKYICGVCLREWPVPWAEKKADEHGLKPQPQASASSDVIVTSPGRGQLLIRLPIRYFRSASERPANPEFSHAPAETRSR